MAVTIISEVLEVANLIETLYPELAPLVPTLTKLISGEPTTDADVIAVMTTRKDLEAKAFTQAAAPVAQT